MTERDQREVYGLGADTGLDHERRLLGGKGASLARMLRAGLPVPPGFTITTRACLRYLRDGVLGDHLVAEIDDAVAALERATGAGLGDADAPLLVSVRSGAPISMPGMMDTVLNLGLTSTTVRGLGRRCGGDVAFVHDSYRRLVESYGAVVVAHRDLLPAHTGATPPDDARAQLLAAIAAVFASWNTPRAQAYRELEGIRHDLGTAVTVQAMVFGNIDDRSGTGVVFTRDPNTGEPARYGDLVFRAQGEDIVSGRHPTLPLNELTARMPDVAAELDRGCDVLEQCFADMVDIEFTVESGRLYFLQVRRGKRAAAAAVRIAVDMAEEGLLTREEAVRRITTRDLHRLAHPHLDPTIAYDVATTGLNASPGVATGRICVDADRVHQLSLDGDVILVRPETSPGDVRGMALAAGILTTSGGLVSHAAIVARDMGIPAVVGAGDVTVDVAARTVTIDGVTRGEGDVLTIDGSTGDVIAGGVSSRTPEPGGYVTTLLAWADELAGGDVAAGGTPAARLEAAHRALSSRIPTTGG